MSNFLPISARDERGAAHNLSVIAPSSVLPTGFGDNAEAAWHSMVMENLAVSDELMLEAGWGHYLDDVERKTGEKLSNPANAYFSNAFGVDGPSDMLGGAIEGALDVNWGLSRHSRYETAQAETRARLDALKAKYPDLEIKGHAEIMDHISRVAKAVREETATVRAGADIWGDLGAFTGGAGAAVLDPINLSTIMLGAPAGAGLLRTFLVEAGLGAGVELATMPSRADWKDQIGSKYTLGDMATDVGLGAVGAGGLGVGIKMVGRGAKEAFDVTGKGLDKLMDAWRSARQAGAVPDTPETRAAETVVESARDVLEQSPFEDSIEGQAAHMAALAEAHDALAQGKLPTGKALDEYISHRRERIASMVERVQTKGGPDAGADAIIYGRLSDWQFDEIHAEAAKHLPDGHNLRIAQRKMDANSVRKVVKDHGKDDIPFLDEHFQHIPDVLEQGELVSVQLKDGRLGIERRAMVDGDWLHAVEVVRNVGLKNPPKKITLDFQTAFWKKGPKKKKGLPPEGEGWPSQPLHLPDTPKRPRRNVQNDKASPAHVSIANGDVEGNTPIARAPEPPTPAEARATIEELETELPAQDQALYRDVQRIIEEDPERMIDFEEPNTDGTVTSGTTTVRDLMDGIDDDIRAIDAFRVCALGKKGP